MNDEKNPKEERISTDFALHLPPYLGMHAYKMMKEAPINGNINSENPEPIGTVKVKTFINRSKAERTAKVR